MRKGVFKAVKKDGTVYYRASITNKTAHISLGSFENEEKAEAAYFKASEIIRGGLDYEPDDWERNGKELEFEKWVMLLNLRKTGIYCKNPIYMYGKYFIYYVDRETGLKFDVDDLFFFRNHKIQKRGGHLFYSDFGMQCSLLDRYGVRSFAVRGRDYYFKNGDELDYTYGNIVVVNRYYGVYTEEVHGRKMYSVKIHMKGNVSVGCFADEREAAVAYNKAADSIEEMIRKKVNEMPCSENGCMHKNDDTQDVVFYNGRRRKTTTKNAANTDEYWDYTEGKTGYRKWRRNYVEELTNAEYIKLYEHIRLSKSFKRYLTTL